MKRVDLIQGSDAWHAWRAQGLGGSSAAAALGVVQPFDGNKVPTGKFTKDGKRRRRWMNGEEVRYREWQRKTGRAPEEPSNFAMRKGTRLEPVIRAAFERRTGFLVEPACYEHNTLPWLRVSLDGITFDEEIILEVKYQNPESHRMVLEGKIPPHYLPQVHHQLLVCDRARGVDLWSYNDSSAFQGDDRYALAFMHRVDNHLDEMREHLASFWECVVSGVYQPMAPAWKVTA